MIGSYRVFSGLPGRRIPAIVYARHHFTRGVLHRPIHVAARYPAIRLRLLNFGNQATDVQNGVVPRSRHVIARESRARQASPARRANLEALRS